VRSTSRGVVGYRKPRAARLLGGLAILAAAPAAAAEVEIDPVTVTGLRLPLDHDTGLSILPTTVQDTPQAITALDAAQLRAQGVTTLEQALRNVPGITIAIGEGGALNGDQFKIRGFDSKDDVYVDGLRDFGVYTRDSFNYEEVHVLKGPSGAMFGRGTTGGVINTISKRPRLAHQTSADLYAGAGDYYRGLLDVNRRLGERTAARLNLMASSTGVADRDLIRSERWGAALSLGFGLGTDTTVTVGLLHQYDRRRPDYGILLVQRPGEIVARPATEYDVGVERSTFTGFRADRDRSVADMLTVRVSRKASDALSLTSDTRYGAYQRYFQYSTLDQCNAACTAALFDNNPANEPLGGIGGSSPYDMEAWGLQNISTARFDHRLGGLRNQAIFGIDLSRQVNDKLFLAYTLPVGIATRPAMPHTFVNPDPEFPTGYGVFRAVPGANINCSGAGNCRTTANGVSVFTNVTGTGIYDTRGESTDVGVFLTDRLWLTEQLSLIGSYRQDAYAAVVDSITYAGQASTLKAKSTLRSPRASLVWEPADDQTYYLSWGKAQTPQGTSVVGSGAALTLTAKDLEPENSEILEAGAKFAIPGALMSATVSVFDVKKDNALQADPNTGFLVAQSGERQRVKGVELGLTGRVTEAWSATVAYSYLQATIEESFSNCAVPGSTAGTPTNIVCPMGVTAAIPVLNTVAVGEQVAFVPKHSAALFTTYDVSARIPGLTVGGDVTYQSKMFLVYQSRSQSFADRATLVPNRIGEVPEAVTVNAFASYRTGPYRFALNVYNLTDALNYTQVQSNRAIPGAGRTVIFSVGASF
jgi:catecholate siderophore receptor